MLTPPTATHQPFQPLEGAPSLQENYSHTSQHVGNHRSRTTSRRVMVSHTDVVRRGAKETVLVLSLLDVLLVWSTDRYSTVQLLISLRKSTE